MVIQRIDKSTFYKMKALPKVPSMNRRNFGEFSKDLPSFQDMNYHPETTESSNSERNNNTLVKNRNNSNAIKNAGKTSTKNDYDNSKIQRKDEGIFSINKTTSTNFHSNKSETFEKSGIIEKSQKLNAKKESIGESAEWETDNSRFKALTL